MTATLRSQDDLTPLESIRIGLALFYRLTILSVVSVVVLVVVGVGLLFIIPTMFVVFRKRD